MAKHTQSTGTTTTSNKSGKEPAPGARGGKRLVIATNRDAGFRYFIEERIEAGMMLIGSEIKSIRARLVSLNGGFIEAREGEMWLLNVQIAEYKMASKFGHEPKRPRKLLLRKREIARLADQVRIKGYTIVPLQLYISDGRAKIEIGLAKGKQQHDKRDAEADRDADRSLKRMIKNNRYED
jgi:SsrA-binding protein